MYLKMNTACVWLIGFPEAEMVFWDKVEAIGKLHILLKHGDLQQGFCGLLTKCLENLLDFLLTYKTQEAKSCLQYTLNLNNNMN